MTTNEQISVDATAEQLHADEAAALDRVVNGPSKLANPRRTTLAHVGTRQR